MSSRAFSHRNNAKEELTVFNTVVAATNPEPKSTQCLIENISGGILLYSLDAGSYSQIGQSVASGSWTKLTSFTTAAASIQWDNANNRFLISRAGTYLIHGKIYLQSSTCTKQVAIYHNGTAVATSLIGSGGLDTIQTQIVINLSIGDYIDLRAFQNSGGTLSTTGSSDTCSKIELIQIK